MEKMRFESVDGFQENIRRLADIFYCPSWSPATLIRSRSSRLCRLQVLSRNKRFYVQMPGETGLRAFAV